LLIQGRAFGLAPSHPRNTKENTMGYDTAVTRESIQAANVAGVAGASMAKVLQFQATRLKAVHALIDTAGTHTAGAVDVYVGTASVGSIATSTATAGSVVSSGVIDVDVPANGLIELKGKANTGTLVASFDIQHQPKWDAALD
jgi:hypothetical protein